MASALLEDVRGGVESIDVPHHVWACFRIGPDNDLAARFVRLGFLSKKPSKAVLV